MLLAAACLLPGCRGGQPDTANLPDQSPIVQVVPLHGKVPGDTGKPIVRQAAEDQPVSSPYNGPEIGKPTPLTQWTPVDRLALTGSSPGLVVCEPVAAQAGAGMADFGAGCGRWLHFSVAGLPQMGQTPLWSSLGRAETELGRTDLRLSLPEAERLATILGVTHAAIGQITGNAAHCTLSYQLYAVPGGKAVGPALQASGTEAQVLSQLPALARRMAALLGVSAPALPAAIQANPAEFGLLGHLDWYPRDDLPSVQTHQLQALAPHLPLANFFLVNTTGDLSDAQWNLAVKTLLTQEPNNGLVWAQIGYSAPGLLALSQTQLARNLQQFPQNYPFAAAETWVQRRLQNSNAERRAAEQTVQNAPYNPDAWLTLGSTISEEGHRLRKGRFVSEITAAEWQFLNSVYPQWLYAVSQAAQLDPLYGKAWDRVAQAATFAGQPRLADQALWKDIALNKTDPDAYAWGLQMYQDKWYGDPQKLHQIAQMLATTAYPAVSQGLYAAKVLRDNEQQPNQFLAQRQTLLSSLLTRTQQAITRNPGDAQAHYDQAYALRLLGRRQEAIVEYKNIVLLRPSDPQSYLDLAQEYDRGEMCDPAIAAYRQALRLDPTSAVVHFNLGWDLKHQKQLPQAEAEMRQAIKIAPSYPEAYAGLGEVLAMEHRNQEAVAAMQQALRLNPVLMPTMIEIIGLLDDQGRYAESLAAGRHAVQIQPDNYMAMDIMADDYLHLKQWDKSIAMSQAALQVNPGGPEAHENLGEAYIGQGRKADAHAEWNQVLAMDNGPTADVARKMLAKYP